MTKISDYLDIESLTTTPVPQPITSQLNPLTQALSPSATTITGMQTDSDKAAAKSPLKVSTVPMKKRTSQRGAKTIVKSKLSHSNQIADDSDDDKEEDVSDDEEDDNESDDYVAPSTRRQPRKISRSQNQVGEQTLASTKRKRGETETASTARSPSTSVERTTRKTAKTRSRNGRSVASMSVELGDIADTIQDSKKSDDEEDDQKPRFTRRKAANRAIQD